MSDKLNGTMPCDHGEVCEHGGLKTNCDICWSFWGLNAWKKRAAQAEADRDVLAAEVRAWRDADTWHEMLEVMDMCDDYSHRHNVEKAQKDVDVSKALLRAKEIE